jgi:iron complex transport system substrate-binding protein
VRILSLLPAATDIVIALGAAEDVAGISHECEWPDVQTPPRISRSVIATETLTSGEIDAAIAAAVAEGRPLYEVDRAQLADLAPDLVLTQGLCNVCALPAGTVQDALAALPSAPDVLSLDGRSIDDMLESIRAIGARIGRAGQARELVASLRDRLTQVARAVHGRPQPSVVCLEWLDPPYACGHWIPEMIDRAGGRDLLGRPGVPSVPISWSDVAAARPQIVIAMPCGYDLDRAREDLAVVAETPDWRAAAGDADVFVAAGGRYFTRPGPSLAAGVEALAAVLHPDAVSWSVPDDAIAKVLRHAGQRQST